MRLQEYNFVVQHRAGKASGNVDHLSRYPVESSNGPAIEPLFAALCGMQEGKTSWGMDPLERAEVRKVLATFCVATTRRAATLQEKHKANEPEEKQSQEECNEAEVRKQELKAANRKRGEETERQHAVATQPRDEVRSEACEPQPNMHASKSQEPQKSTRQRGERSR